MAAVLAASARAPLTVILLLFELTRDYRIVLPLMAAVGLSVWLVERMQPTSSSSNLQQLGLQVEKQTEILSQILVEEAMNQSPLMLPAGLPVLQTVYSNDSRCLGQSPLGASLPQCSSNGCRSAGWNCYA